MTIGNESQAAFGYNPAIAALFDRLKPALSGLPTSPDRDLCLSTRDDPVNGSTRPGYCYVEESNDMAGLLQGCPVTQPRKLQFVGANTPRSGSVAFIVCGGSAPTDM